MLYNINDLKVGSDQDIILLIKCVEQGESQNGAYQRLMARDKQDHEIAIMNFTDISVKFKLIKCVIFMMYKRISGGNGMASSKIKIAAQKTRKMYIKIGKELCTLEKEDIDYILNIAKTESDICRRMTTARKRQESVA